MTIERRVRIAGEERPTLELRVPDGVPASIIWVVGIVTGIAAMWLAVPNLLGRIAGLVALALTVWRPRDSTIGVWLVVVAGGLLAKPPWSLEQPWWSAGIQMVALVLVVPTCVLALRLASNLTMRALVGRDVVAAQWGTLWRAQVLVQPLAVIAWWPMSGSLPWFTLLGLLAAVAVGGWLLLRTGDDGRDDVT